jgi:hypothetical protein
MKNLDPFPASMPGLRLLWCPLALGIAVLALTVAWLIRPRSLDFDSESFLSSAVGAVGMLMAPSALPLPPQTDEA